MQLKTRDIDYGELIINCLAVLVLLSVGVVCGAI
jgi:hypothetical protein